MAQPAARSPSRYRWVILALLVGTLATRIPVGISIGIMLPDITTTLGLSALQQGWLGGALNLGTMVWGVPGAWLISRFNPQLLVGITSAAAAFLTLAQGAAPTYWFLLGMRTLTGSAMISTAAPRILLIQQWFSLREIVLINGIQIAVVGVTEALTLSLTPFLLQAVAGWRNALYVFGGLGVAGMLAWVGLGKERKEPPEHSAPPKPGVSPLLVVLTRPDLWVMALGQLGAPAFWWGYATFWPTYMQEHFALPLGTSGFLFGLTSLGMAPGGLFFGWLCSRRPGLRRPVLWGCGVTLCTTAWAMLLTDSVPLLVLICLVGGLGWGFAPIMNTMPFELPEVRPREVAVASSFLWTVGSVGGLLGPVLAGWLIEQWSDMSLALAVLAPLALGVSLSAFVSRRLPLEQERVRELPK